MRQITSQSTQDKSHLCTMKSKFLSIPIFFYAVILLTSCQLPFLVRALDAPLPKRDIVFQLDSSRNGSAEQQIGFVNADGTGLIQLDYLTPAMVEPLWAGGDYGCMLFYSPPWKLQCITAEGLLHQINEIRVLETAPVPGRNEAIVSMLETEEPSIGLRRVDIKTGEFLETYEILFEGGLYIGTNPIHEQYIVYSRGFMDDQNLPYLAELVLLDTVSGDEQVLLRNEIEDPDLESSFVDAAFSPDGQWIAYTASAGGIYLIRPDGSDNHQVVDAKPNRDWSTQWIPSASWSPDNQSIIYHRCMRPNNCNERVELNGIYKLDIETLEEELIMEGGLNPYWRLVE